MTEESTSLGVTITADGTTLEKSAGNIMSVKDNGINLAKMEHGTLGDLLLYGATGVPARLGVGARGEVLFYNNTTLAKLGVGTAGQALLSGGAGADPTWGAGGALNKVAETVISGSAVTSVDFTSLDLEADKNYILSLFILNPTGSNAYYRMYFNDDTTDSNYNTQNITADASNIACINANTANVIHAHAGTNVYTFGTLSKVAGEPARLYTTNCKSSGPNLWLYGMIWTGSSANVTKITINSNIGSGIGIGSRLTLFRLVS